MEKSVTLTTDGACLGNPGPGGWAALLRHNDQERLFSDYVPDTTNNRMELLAVIEGLRALKEPCEVTIVTDSQYVMNAFEKGWLENWQKNGWKTASKKPVRNRDLWETLTGEMERHQVTWRWVRGHSGDVDNERVDQAARDAAKSGE